MTPSHGHALFTINGRFLEQPLSGVQRYSREIVAALDRQIAADPVQGEHWQLATTGTEIDPPRLSTIERRAVPSRLRSHAWEQVALAGAASGRALIGLAGSGPLLHPRQLVVIHDANVYRNPDYFSRAYGTWHRSIGRALARRAAIGTVSQFSRGELADVLAIDPDSIPVIYNGSDHMRRRPPSAAAHDRLGLAGRPYFVLLGNLTRNKNVAVAIDAIARVPGALLVLVGGVDHRVFGAGDRVREPSERVIFAGRVEDAEVAGLLGEARALLFPSLYEGFGIPPVEAMVNRCPVIASDIPAVREVCGDAALYFDPHDAAALARAMTAVMDESKPERSARQDRGEARASSFSWDRSARALLSWCRASLAPAAKGPPR